MGVRLTIEIENKVQFDRAFNDVGSRLEDFTPIWDELRDELYNILSDQFQSGGAAGASGKWQELSPAYEEIKIKKYNLFAPGADTLYATKAMYFSLTRPGGDNIFESSKDEMAFGTRVPYAKFHQNGGENLPQREIFSFSDKQKRGIQKRVQKKLLEIMRGTGFVATIDNYTEI